MPVKISCPYCGAKILNTLESYADHINKKHSNNLELCAWTREELAKIEKSKDSKPLKYRNKPIDRIPPKREKKLPKYLQRQIPPRNQS